MNIPSTTDKPTRSPIAVALVEPRIPQNTGNVARLCVCAGVDLYLVGSLGFRLGDPRFKRSGAGEDYIDQINLKHVPDYPDLLQEKPGWTPYFLSTKAKRSYTEVDFVPDTLLVFGSETHGLPGWLIEENPDTSLRIPMTPDARSLNLANSVAIVLYEVIRQLNKQGATLPCR